VPPLGLTSVGKNRILKEIRLKNKRFLDLIVEIRYNSRMTEPIEALQPLERVKSLINPDLSAVEALVRTTSSSIPLADSIIAHVIQAGGKRLRPMTLLLWAKHFGYAGEHHIDIAASLELVHTATLLHDDVVDASPLRRGQPTASALWGNAASVLTGDYVYAQSFTLLTRCFNPHITHAVSTATTRLAEGELLQLMHRHDLALSEEQYLYILSCKTGQLFELASLLPGHLTHQNEATLAQLSHYGMNLGLAFQLMDDVLDYTSDDATLGKRVGDDLADGNLTLPLIYALQKATPAEQALIKEVITTADLNKLPAIKTILHDCGAIAYTQSLADTYMNKALKALSRFEPSEYTEALQHIAEYAIQRIH
jgi:octaprenyl-diphosphate synthase